MLHLGVIPDTKSPDRKDTILVLVATPNIHPHENTGDCLLWQPALITHVVHADHNM